MSPARRALLPWIALVTIYLVWGSTYLAIKLVVGELPPLASASARFTLAGVVMAGLAAFVDGRAALPTRRQLVDYALIGVGLLCVSNGAVMWSETRIPSGLAALIVATVPLWLTLLDGLRPGGQRWTARSWTGVAIGLAGVAVIVRPEAGLGPREMPGVLALFAASGTWTIASLYAQSVPKRLPVLTAAAVEMIAGGLALAVASRVLGEDLATFGAASPRAWWALAYLAVFGSLVAFTAFAYCLNELPATVVGTYAYVNPVVAVILGAAVLGEPLSWSMLTGGALILAAVVLASTGRPASPKVEERLGRPPQSLEPPALVERREAATVK